MGTNYAPVLIDLFLYSYESEFLGRLVKSGDLPGYLIIGDLSHYLPWETCHFI